MIYLLAFAATVLAAQSATPTVPSASQAAPAKLSVDLPLATLMSAPESRAAVLKQLPDIQKHPAYEQFKGVSLRRLQQISGGAIDEKKLAAIDADLAAIK